MTALDNLALALRLARRELRGGLAGFRILVACLALGVAAIAAVGSVHRAVTAGLEADARTILGGDVDLSLHHRTATGAQLAYLRTAGQLSRSAALRAMARVAGGERPMLVELKAVDAAYPLYGAVRLDPAMPLATALAEVAGIRGAVADRAILNRLGIGLGENVKLGETEFEIRATLVHEPDRGAAGFILGPRLMIPIEGLPATELVQPGSVVRYHYRLRLPPAVAGDAWVEALKDQFPKAGWRVRDLDNAAPGLQRFIDRLSIYLTLIGLSALLVGGVGVANATKSYLDGRIATIATLKCLGAPGRLMFQVYLFQITILAIVGIALGVLAGGLAPFAITALIADQLPVAARLGIYPDALVLAAGYGILTALAFALWPLARARDIPPGALFRALVAPVRRLPRVSYLLATIALGMMLAGLALWATADKRLALWFIAGAAAALLAFWGTGRLLARLAALAGASHAITLRRPGMCLALANLHRPGSAMPTVMLSLGIGLTVLNAVALIEGNLTRQVNERMPQAAPAYYFIDIQPHQVDAFDQTVRSVEGVIGTERMPHLRGRIARIDGVPVEQAAIAPEAAWVTRSDRGLTYSAAPPSGTRLASGAWWQTDYHGPPLVSFDAEAAAGMGVGIGDTLTINVLGREVRATIANLRRIDWGTLGLNFVFVFAPGTLEAAPQTHIATARVVPAAEEALERAVTDRFKNVSAIRVREALETVSRVLDHIGSAVRVAAAVTLAVGTLVLAGAVAAGHQRRVYDAVVLKVLGARRRNLFKAYLLEYGLLGPAAAAVACLLGTGAAYVVLTQIMRTDWIFLPATLLATTVACVAVTLAFGFVGTWRALGRKAAPVLRNE